MPAPKTQIEVRDVLVAAPRADLVGPMARDEVLENRPSRWYLTGFLVPNDTPLEERREPGAGEALSIDVEEGDDPDVEVAGHQAFLPSSMGLSFLVGPATRKVELTARRADHQELDTPTTLAWRRREREHLGLPVAPVAEDDAAEKVRLRYWKRVADQGLIVTVHLDGDRPAIPLTSQRDVHLRVVIRPAPLGEGPAGTRVASLFLVDGREPSKPLGVAPGTSLLRAAVDAIEGNTKIRRSQVLTTGGPGALVVLVEHAVIIKGPNSWKYPTDKDDFIEEPRQARQALSFLRKTPGWAFHDLHLRNPPRAEEDGASPSRGIHAREFPSWYLCQRCSSLVKRDALDNRRRHICTDDTGTRNKPVPTVPTRFVSACAHGKIQDIDWRKLVHYNLYEEDAPKPFWCTLKPELGLFEAKDNKQYTADLVLRTSGTSGELEDLVLSCRCCGKSRGLQHLVQPKVFGQFSAWRPWLKTNDPSGELESKLLIRTGSNAWLLIQYSVLSVPEPQRELKHAVARHWAILKKMDNLEKLQNLLELVVELAELNQWEPPDSGRTVGGLVDVGRDIVRHLRRAVEMNERCSNDSVCSQHLPDDPQESRHREGAACHGCLLIAEPSCERMNRDLDRCFVVATVEPGSEDVAFLDGWVAGGGDA